MDKKLFFICMFAVCLCSGCGHDSDDPVTPPTPPGPGPEPDPDPVAIELYTSLESRAAVNGFDGTEISIAAGTSSGHITEVWNGVATGSRIALTPVQYYPADSSAIYLRGFYPRTGSLADGIADYTLTGKEDLLYAGLTAGSLGTPFTPSAEALTFHHLLAQLNVSLDTEEDFQGTYRLKHLSIEGSAGSASLDVLNGTVQFGEDPIRLEVYNVEDFSGEVVKAGSTLSLGYILIQPKAALTLNLVLARDENPEHDIVLANQPVEFEGGSSETGLSYKLSIKLPNDIGKEDPDNPDNPDNPDPDNPDNPDNPDLDNPDTPDPDNPDHPNPDDPDPGKPENPDKVELTLYATITAWSDVSMGDIDIPVH